jgi:hypothetical protein
MRLSTGFRHKEETDGPIAALLTDLKRTGLWDETLVLWGGEFGRTPTSEGLKKPGRDDNPYGFSMRLVGAGVRAARRSARPTSWTSTRWWTAGTSPTSTPPSYISWAGTTLGLRISTRAATVA